MDHVLGVVYDTSQVLDPQLSTRLSDCRSLGLAFQGGVFEVNLSNGGDLSNESEDAVWLGMLRHFPTKSFRLR